MPQIRGCVVNLPGDGNCENHVARGAEGGPIAPIKVMFRLQPRTHEYRLYRSVDDGPLSLLAPAAAIYDTNNAFESIVRTDDTMPPSYSRLCYYVQLLDEHGNGGPMTLLGCKTVVPPSLPVPVLSEPQAVGSNANPQVSLNWFCPPSGVYRFQILIERTDQPGSGNPSGLTSPKLIVNTNHNRLAVYSGLLHYAFDLASFDEAQETPPISAAFGPGPKFTMTANIVTNVPYLISVSSEDAAGDLSTPSAAWKFTWTPTNPVPEVPWPARPLPSVQSFDQTNPAVASVPWVPAAFNPRVSAVLLRSLNGQLDQQYPVGIRIGDLKPITSAPNNIGTTNFLTFSIANRLAPTAAFRPPPCSIQTTWFSAAPRPTRPTITRRFSPLWSIASRSPTRITLRCRAP